MKLSVSEGWYSYNFDIDCSHPNYVYVSILHSNRYYDSASVPISNNEIVWSSISDIYIPPYIKSKADQVYKRYFQMKAFW